MSDIEQTEQTEQVEIVLTQADEAAKSNAIIAYGLMALGLFTGIFWVVGAIWAMIKKEDAQGTIFQDHYQNITQVFWWGLGLTILGMITALFIIGYLIILAVWLWSIYRLLKGISKITSNKAYN